MLRIRRERLKRGWTLLELAVRCRIDPSALSRIERAAWPCGPKWRRQISEAFGLPEDELFQEVERDEHK